ncbi:MAG: flagellar biosynthesis protein FlgC [Alphaproteobacteria bacterium]|nr:flagellar biosynthesis protein FlgC [Alphaproteobacteria bacterium]
MSSIYSIALSGMNEASQRMLSAAQNIANISTTGSVPTPSSLSGVYRPTDVVSISAGQGQGVQTQTVYREPAYRVAYDPQSSFANGKGFVAQPNVDLTASIVDTIMAAAVYKANAKMLETARDMNKTLLDTFR